MVTLQTVRTLVSGTGPGPSPAELAPLALDLVEPDMRRDEPLLAGTVPRRDVAKWHRSQRRDRRVLLDHVPMHAATQAPGTFGSFTPSPTSQELSAV